LFLKIEFDAWKRRHDELHETNILTQNKKEEGCEFEIGIPSSAQAAGPPFGPKRNVEKWF
jgi:hypothetical protein